MKLRNRQSGEIKEFVLFDGKEMQSGLTLENLAREWEDYEPVEPLIKDEKIRKAVRAWAEGNNIESVHYDAFWRGFRRDNSSITVWEELPLEDNKVYTIAELCGEEEE